MRAVFSLFAILALAASCVRAYQVGVGIYDITGPAAELGMMGYAMTNQTAAGLHFRLRARAFVIASDDGSDRVVYVSTDSCMMFTSIKRDVVNLLQQKFGNIYNQDNVLLSGTHTHSGPGGYAEYLIFDITTWGFNKDNHVVIAEGIVNAIAMAHTNMKSNARILLNSGTLLDSNLNRSPSAYANNPAEEKAKYAYNVDKLMTVLRFDTSNQELGTVAWFAVHGTSMQNTNKLISGDNKGYASLAFEKYKNGNSSRAGMGPFVAAFGQSNEGDVTPNTRGAFCWNGQPCDYAHSTCGGTSQGCHGYGPGKNMFESTQIIGTNQFQKALSLYNSANVPLSGPIAYVHTFIDMSNVTVSPQFAGTDAPATTCLSALGDAFAAGTTDGPGDFNFVQGTNSSSTNPYWNYIGSFLSDPTPEQIACQAPKPILLNTGGINFPIPWEPKLLPIQLLRIGQFVIIGVPGEFTTMAGRRLRDTVQQTLASNGVNATVVIAGLANAYSHYIATKEEYQVQRYEGASTLFGPYTLAAYQQEFSKLAAALAKGTSVPPGPTPPDFHNDVFTFLPPVIEDSPPLFKNFGDVDKDVHASYSPGDTVTVSFWGANPRNNLMTQSDGFLTVETRSSPSAQWQVIYNDGDWETKLFWERVWLAESRITVTWDIPASFPTGSAQYRIRHFGYYKPLLGDPQPYSGTSGIFTIPSK